MFANEKKKVLKLIDFGISKSVEPFALGKTIFGTPGYLGFFRVVN